MYCSSKVDKGITEVVNEYMNPISGIPMAKEYEGLPLIDAIRNFMQKCTVEFRIESAIFAKARFYAIAWVEDGQLYLRKIEADAY